MVTRMWRGGRLAHDEAWREDQGRTVRVFRPSDPAAEAAEQAAPDAPLGRDMSMPALPTASTGPLAEAAACRGSDPVLFFGGADRESAADRAARISAAQAVCGDCTVRDDCREIAAANRERYGVWGEIDFETSPARPAERELEAGS